MAFNPFHSFRKHQKKMFAVLTIFCMFIFVLQSGMGQGDWFSMFGDWIAGRSGGPKAEATLYGKDIDGNTIAMTQKGRVIASRYMELAQQAAQSNFYRRIFNQIGDYDKNLQQVIQMLQQVEMNSLRSGPEQYLQYLGLIQNQLLSVRTAIDAGNSPKKSEQINLIERLHNMLQQKVTRFQQKMMNPQDSYFGGALEGREATLDFLIWKHKAEQLKVNYTQPDMAAVLATETFHQLTREATSEINDILVHQFPGIYTPELLTSALTDEFRVRTAKTSVAGITVAGNFQTFTRPPILGTPEEAFDWFKDNRTAIRVGLIELPVAKFVAQVPDPTDDKPLRELYAKYKNDEPNPALERPGFKEPRRIKIEWVAVPEDSEYYRKVANIALGLDPMATAIRVAEEYDSYKTNSPSWRNPIAFGYRTGVHDSSVMQAEVIATLAGTAAGTGPLGAALAGEGQAIVREMRDRAVIGATTILAGAMEPAPLGIDALPMLATPSEISQQQLRPTLLMRMQKEIALAIAKDDLAKFGTELTKLGKDADPKKAVDYVDQFVASRQFARGGMAEPRDRYALASDPGLEPIRKAVNRILSARRQDDPSGEIFAAEMADTFGPSKAGNYQAANLPSPGVTYVFWRRRIKSRKLSHLIKRSRKSSWLGRSLRRDNLRKPKPTSWRRKRRAWMRRSSRDLAAQVSPRPLIELPDMALLNRQITPTAGPPQYDPAIIPRSRITYPGEPNGEMTTKVMDLRKQDLGGTTVVFDQPKANFYIAGLLTKQVPTQIEFRTAYLNSMGPDFMRDRLFDYFRGERFDAYRKGLMAQLRNEAQLKIHDTKGGEVVD